LEILKSQEVEDWIIEVMTDNTGSESTKEMYLRYFNEFNEWLKSKYGYNAIELIAKTIKEFQFGKKIFAETIVGRYFQYLISDERGLERNTAKTHYGVLRSFFRSNSIPFTRKTPNASATTRYVIPEPEELMKAYRYADFDEKLRMGILNDTGARPGDVVELVFVDIKRDYRKRARRAYIRKLSNKEDLEFAVCLSLATTELLWKSLDSRIESGETLTENSPLLTRKNEPGQPIGENQLYRNIVAIGQRVGIAITPKTFRKKFRTDGTPIIKRDHIMKMAAWKIPGAGKHYVLPSEKKTRELYRRIEPVITLEPLNIETSKIAQRQTIAEMIKALGQDPDEWLRKANISGSIETETSFLTKTFVGFLQESQITDPAMRVAKVFEEALAHVKGGKPNAPKNVIT